MTKRVYVAGPIIKGDKGHNVRQALQAGNAIRLAGYAPFVPHLSVFWDLMGPPGPDTYDTWLPIDYAFLEVCNAVLRLPGPSDGADRETTLAYSLGIPVFYDMPTLLYYLDGLWLEREGFND